MAKSDTSMAYEEFAPAPALRPWIAAYWRFRLNADSGEVDHSVPLTGGVMLLTNARSPAMLVGARTTPLRTRVRSGDEFRGVHLWPGAASSLLGPGARGMRERVVPASTILGNAFVDALTDRVWCDDAIAEAMDDSLSALSARAEPLDDLVMKCVFQLIRDGGRPTLAALAEVVGLSEKQLRRRFVAAVEMTPKEFGRLRRMRSAAAQAVLGASQGWVEIAAEHGYADQAHLVREFRRIAGLTPKVLDDHLKRIRHGSILS